MNLELFIAKKITISKKGGGNISHPIISIAKISIALGIAVMILAVAIVTGFKSEITNKVIGFGSHIQITNYDNNSSFETNPIEKNAISVSSIEKIPGVSHIQSFATKPGILKTKSDIQGIVLNGIGKDYDWSFFKNHLVEGKTIQLTDSTKSNDILISEKLSNLLQLKVGNKLSVYFIQQPPRVRSFTVAGIYNTGMEEFDKLFLICDIQHIQKLNDWSNNQVSGYEIFIDNFDDLDLIDQQIKGITAASFTDDGAGLKVRSIVRKYPQIFSWLDMLDMNVWIILSLMILVAGFNMVSGLLIIILEKTNMIGILKALGTENWSIRKIFLYQSSMLIGQGLLWGNIIGISVCLLQYFFEIIPLDPTNYYVDTVPINLKITHIILLNIGSLIVTVSMLLVPSYLITKITPAKAIKFD
ncbi:FtsX-like permease family protein [Labilibaculum sp. A4]|uniref:ABC transporter permease n=1 Tax=Labilibaculum euxinus TaxID=2686357 RepID=UPI000F61BF50|nr:FtsX-like permease family protein [Labilibaculum euxinus]MDQ1772338.1 ABC transporter permease [Labilibaculum euxinus]MWN77964.1 FtsX-like permease family protein [Labilibaculum euxinus]